MTTLCTYCIYFLTSKLFSFIISSAVKHEFSSIWKYISCCNDVMNHVDRIIKHDVNPQKMHSCSKIISGISFVVLKIPIVNKKKYIMGDIA